LDFISDNTISISFDKKFPKFLASTAAVPVTPVIRRIPFATAVSSINMNAKASLVLLICVPPQNSIDDFNQLSYNGLAMSE
jgi:hypothetical protein